MKKPKYFYDGKPCNRDAWYALYLNMSHPKQRAKLPWQDLVLQMGLPEEWANKRPRKRQGETYDYSRVAEI